MDLNGKKVLIVEDDKNIRDVLVDILSMTGCNVLVTKRAKDAIRIGEEEKPDLVIMDIRLPRKARGIGAAKNIRKIKDLSNVPIIFATGCAKCTYEGELANFSNYAYLRKPFKFSEFMSIVEDKLNVS
jgi:DNA-binding response OmpR family regulator